MGVRGKHPFRERGVTGTFGDFELDALVEIPCVGAGIGIGVVTGVAVEAVFFKMGFCPFVFGPPLWTFLTPGSFPGTSSFLL